VPAKPTALVQAGGAEAIESRHEQSSIVHDRCLSYVPELAAETQRDRRQPRLSKRLNPRPGWLTESEAPPNTALHPTAAGADAERPRVSAIVARQRTE
jgi:hypothetical protein